MGILKRSKYLTIFDSSAIYLHKLAVILIASNHDISLTKLKSPVGSPLSSKLSDVQSNWVSENLSILWELFLENNELIIFMTKITIQFESRDLKMKPQLKEMPILPFLQSQLHLKRRMFKNEKMSKMLKNIFYNIRHGPEFWGILKVTKTLFS